MKTLLFFHLFFFITSSLLSSPLPPNWEEVNMEVLSRINLAQKTFINGDVGSAKEILSDAYFEKFEAFGMEMVVKKYISSARAYELERLFGKIRKGMSKNDTEKVNQAISDLTERLKYDAAKLDRKNIPVEGAGYIISSDVTPQETEIKENRQTLHDIQKKTSQDISPPEEIAKIIEQKLQEALIYYKRGDSRRSKSTVSEAYFDIFEGKGLETMIAVQSGSLKSELESRFANVLGLIEKGLPLEQIESGIIDLSSQVQKAAKELNVSANWFGLFLSSLFIIVREGFEAILIISALIAYLRKTDNNDKVKIVGLGAIAAILLSIITAILFLKIYTQSGSSKEILEGITMLIAAAVLFYVSYWLTSKAEAAKWMAYIQNQVVRSIGKGSIFTLGLASFIVVYREGAETILFYSALFSNVGQGSSLSIWSGFAVGCLILLAIYYAFKYGAAKIPIRPFFTITSAILYYMAFVFAGNGIVELQIGGLIRATPINWMPRLVFLGIHPTMESVALQSIILMAAAIALSYLFIVQPFRARGRVLQDVAHTLGDLRRLHDRVEHIRTHTGGALKLTIDSNGTKDMEIKKISGHLNEIDRYSHELEGHLKSLESDLSVVLGNVQNKKKDN